MTQVDFYILSQSALLDRLNYACRLTEKAFRNGHQIYLHTNNKAESHTLVEQLWGYKNTSFLPSDILEESNQQETPISVGHGNHCGSHSDIMVNLANSVPPFYSRFHRVCEIVVQEPEILETTRQSYRFYQHRGYPLKAHKL